MCCTPAIGIRCHNGRAGCWNLYTLQCTDWRTRSRCQPPLFSFHCGMISESYCASLQPLAHHFIQIHLNTWNVIDIVCFLCQTVMKKVFLSTKYCEPGRLLNDIRWHAQILVEIGNKNQTGSFLHIQTHDLLRRLKVYWLFAAVWGFRLLVHFD